MTKCKLFTVCILTLALLLATTSQAEDAFWTYRFQVSTDGGENWSEIIGAGDTGLWEIEGEGEDADTTSVYQGNFENFGSVIDADNCVNFLAPLYGYGDYNPLDRVDGIYHIKVDVEGNAMYNLVAAMGEGDFSWVDAGIDADGNLYTIWVNRIVPDEGVSYGELYAAKSTDGGENWTEPFMLSGELDVDKSYPHMTSNVGEFFYVIYQIPGEVEETWDHNILKVPAALEGDVALQVPGATSGTYASYYTGGVDPIQQDVAAGYVYFGVRNVDLDGVAVGYTSDGGENWAVDGVPGAQRYPSIGLDLANETPWVFSNFGVPDEPGLHQNWYSFDEVGYGGGQWTEAAALDGVEYPGEMLYTSMGAWTTNGRVIGGCNVWAYPDPYITPIGYQIKYSDDSGENWSEAIRLFDIWNDGIQGGPLTHCHLMAGAENYVFLAFGGRYGYTDIVAPEIATTDMSSVMLGEDKVLTVEVNDNVDIYYYDEDEYWDVWIDYSKQINDTTIYGGTLMYDSLDIDANGIGTYWFTMLDSVEYADTDTTTAWHLFEAGDQIPWYSYCWDDAGNLAIEHGGNWDNVWTVNEGWTEVKNDEANVPVKFEVGQNYPNPFNSSTIIPFTLNRSSFVKISVIDMNGRLVETLFDGRASAGKNQVVWTGDRVPSGVYIYMFETAGMKHIGKMTLVR
ncbi:MAG: T9SS type A sorting domain-containing protein [Candidatus Hatepunaea meridiana]|nr:T9SS type A sorting domain-containing protein [Candidatus Hatepunaea meridiana]